MLQLCAYSAVLIMIAVVPEIYVYCVEILTENCRVGGMKLLAFTLLPLPTFFLIGYLNIGKNIQGLHLPINCQGP